MHNIKNWTFLKTSAKIFLNSTIKLHDTWIWYLPIFLSIDQQFSETKEKNKNLKTHKGFDNKLYESHQYQYHLLNQYKASLKA